jgi:peptidoglycan/LPS O-acetylase OafA/YrhL
LLERKVQEHISIALGTVLELVVVLLVVTGITTDISTDMLTIVAFAALVFVVFGKRSIISNICWSRNIWSKLSKYSYSVYLNHAIIIYVLSYINGHIFEIPNGIKPILTFGSVLIYAVFAKHIIDKVWCMIEERLVIKNG